ncbi:MAG TPA: PKD domain-containing protein [Bacteroidales bacterium]|nr:PKD domain-containing protein [Bacteroidales bacterium]
MIKRLSHILLFFALLVPANTFAQQQPSLFKIQKLPFNTGMFSEISPVIFRDGILFCSNRRFSAITDRTSFDGRRLYNIYFAEREDTSDWRKPVEIKSSRSSFFNNGPLCVAPDGRTVYFSSEIETSRIATKRNFTNHIGIFKGIISGDRLDSVSPFKYNSTEYDIGQPSISKDGKYLYFASDMPGGQGKSDLYYCEFVNNEWSKPVNLGPGVNSPETENYPFISPSGRLYFSSDRPGGDGKLDVYYTFMIYGKWEPPVHLAEPVNSPSDDFAFVSSDDQQTGYFSSGRSGNDDIYKFTSTIIRKASCDTLVEDFYCFRFEEENAMKYDSMPFRYEWRFGDGEKATGVVVEHCYKGPGTYQVHLDVVNLVTNEVKYNEKSETLELTATVQPYISAPDSIPQGRMISMNADSTNLPGWNIAQYYWNFGDETVAIGKDVNKSYLRPGVYNIQLIVSTRPMPDGTKREACVSKNIIVFKQP